MSWIWYFLIKSYMYIYKTKLYTFRNGCTSIPITWHVYAVFYASNKHGWNECNVALGRNWYALLFSMSSNGIWWSVLIYRSNWLWCHGENVKARIVVHRPDQTIYLLLLIMNWFDFIICYAFQTYAV